MDPRQMFNAPTPAGISPPSSTTCSYPSPPKPHQYGSGSDEEEGSFSLPQHCGIPSPPPSSSSSSAKQTPGYLRDLTSQFQANPAYPGGTGQSWTPPGQLWHQGGYDPLPTSSPPASGSPWVGAEVPRPLPGQPDYSSFYPGYAQPRVSAHPHPNSGYLPSGDSSWYTAAGGDADAAVVGGGGQGDGAHLHSSFQPYSSGFAPSYGGGDLNPELRGAVEPNSGFPVLPGAFGQYNAGVVPSQNPQAYPYLPTDQQHQQQQQQQLVPYHQHHQQQQQQQQQTAAVSQQSVHRALLPQYDWRYVEYCGKIYPGDRRSPALGQSVFCAGGGPEYCGQGNTYRPGPAISLVNNEMWRTFYQHCCEMIITKTGRRMFPTINVRLSGLDPKRRYNVYVDLVLAERSHLKYTNGRWQPSGQADTNARVRPPAGKLPWKGIKNSTTLGVTSDGRVTGLNLQDCQYGRVFLHPDSPNTGSFWMKGELCFSKMKLTNNRNDDTGLVIISSMHKYQPRVHVMEVEEGEMGIKEVVVSAIFPETQFVAVTAYQNTDVTSLKIENNPFAKGFRETNNTAPPFMPLAPTARDHHVNSPNVVVTPPYALPSPFANAINNQHNNPLGQTEPFQLSSPPRAVKSKSRLSTFSAPYPLARPGKQSAENGVSSRLVTAAGEVSPSQLQSQGTGGQVSSGSQVAGSHLSGSQVAGNHLSGSPVAGSHLSGSQVAGSHLSGSQLPGSDYHQASSQSEDPDRRKSNEDGMRFCGPNTPDSAFPGMLPTSSSPATVPGTEPSLAVSSALQRFVERSDYRGFDPAVSACSGGSGAPGLQQNGYTGGESSHAQHGIYSVSHIKSELNDAFSVSGNIQSLHAGQPNGHGGQGNPQSAQQNFYHGGQGGFQNGQGIFHGGQENLHNGQAGNNFALGQALLRSLDHPVQQSPHPSQLGYYPRTQHPQRQAYPVGQGGATPASGSPPGNCSMVHFLQPPVTASGRNTSPTGSLKHSPLSTCGDPFSDDTPPHGSYHGNSPPLTTFPTPPHSSPLENGFPTSSSLSESKFPLLTYGSSPHAQSGYGVSSGAFHLPSNTCPHPDVLPRHSNTPPKSAFPLMSSVTAMDTAFPLPPVGSLPESSFPLPEHDPRASDLCGQEQGQRSSPGTY